MRHGSSGDRRKGQRRRVVVRRPDPAVALMRIGALQSVPPEGGGRPALLMILAITPTAAANRSRAARVAAPTADMMMRTMQMLAMT